uniref:Uncharacterized protein n=1 Tax=Oryza punctata TaxID=4537 RepID=A0A0E0JTK3_ORYPU
MNALAALAGAGRARSLLQAHLAGSTGRPSSAGEADGPGRRLLVVGDILPAPQLLQHAAPPGRGVADAAMDDAGAAF